VNREPDRQLWLPLVVEGELGTCDLSAENPTEKWGLMERIVAPENLRVAYGRVMSNAGAPGTDGMTVEALAGYLRAAWPAIRERLLAGTYRPAPVRRHELPKPGGGVRVLGTAPARREPRPGVEHQQVGARAVATEPEPGAEHRLAASPLCRDGCTLVAHLNGRNRPVRDPHAGWCGRGGAARLPPIRLARKTYRTQDGNGDMSKEHHV